MRILLLYSPEEIKALGAVTVRELEQFFRVVTSLVKGLLSE